MANPTRRLLVHLTIAAPLERVWRALRDPEEIARWFGWDAETLKDEIDFIFVKGASPEPARFYVSHVEPDSEGYRLSFGEWEGVADSFEIEPAGDATRLRVIRSGPAKPVEAYDEIAEGWVTFVQQLRLALERHPDEARRTIFLSGASKAGTGAPSAALGLDRQLPEGSPYSARLTTGDHVSGTVWHKTAFQTGFHVEQWGDGLIVVTDRGPDEKRPHGGGSVVITTYGLSDAAFGELDARWKAWWAARFD